MKAKIRRITFEEINISRSELITQVEAGKILGITPEGVRSAMNAGRLPMVFLKGKSRRVTLRSAVEEMAREKQE